MIVQHYLKTQTAEEVSPVCCCCYFYMKRQTKERISFSLWSLLVFVALGIDEIDRAQSGHC